MTIHEYNVEVGDHFYNRSKLRYNNYIIPKYTIFQITDIIGHMIYFEYFIDNSRYENFLHKNSPYAMKCIICNRDRILKELFS